jgi:prepilin-type processing-associated H-X9-DG protein
MRRSARGMKGRAAFTLRELVVVLAVAGALALMALPALAGLKGHSKLAQCEANLRRLVLAIHIYGSENNNRLPQNASGGSWLWDTPKTTTDLLAPGGATMDAWYCPGFPAQSNIWNFQTSYRVLGYALALPGTVSMIVSNANPNLVPQPNRVGATVLPAIPAAARVMVADATISSYGQNVTSSKFNYTYTGIAGGWAQLHATPHMNGRFPAGGNLGMLDGHVEWRKFENMEARSSGGTPGFWW